MARCPMCKKKLPDEPEHRPFCSARCKDMDLGRWLNEEYRVSRPARDDELPEPPLEEEERLLH